jgi:DNA-binding LacI/PurR family transcriptional regulator
VKPKKVRLQDLAKAAGVSIATVSRVISRTGRVAPDIQERVRGAAAKLQVDLRQRKKTRLLAFLLGNRPLLHPFHSRILAGVESYCAQRDYNIVFLSFHYPPHAGWNELPVPAILRRRDFVDGFILAGAHSQNLLDLIARSGLPCAVQANSVLFPWLEDQCDSVFFDDLDGGYQMTRHLQSLGHTQIWFVGNRQLPWFDRCYTGYARAMTEAALSPLAAGADSEQPREIGYLGTKSILAQGRPVTAIFAGSDAIALGVYEALSDSGLSVPDDISVAGLDDIEAGTMQPRLATVHVFLEQVGKQLAEFVLSRIANPELQPRRSVVPTKLIKGESCHKVSSTWKAGEKSNPPTFVESPR